jgi:hypothetical protein
MPGPRHCGPAFLWPMCYHESSVVASEQPSVPLLVRIEVDAWTALLGGKGEETRHLRSSLISGQGSGNKTQAIDAPQLETKALP